MKLRITLGAAMLGLLLALPAEVSAATGQAAGVVPDVPRGTPPPRVVPRATTANVDYFGGPVMHTNRTHVIFWDPDGRGWPPGYQGLISGFLAGVAADSGSTGNVYALTQQYSDVGGRAAYASTFAGAISDSYDPDPGGSCTLPPTAPPGWSSSQCHSDAAVRSEVAHVVSTYHLPTGLGELYFVLTPEGTSTCQGSGPQNCSLGGSANGFCGYHSSTTVDGGTVLFADDPYAAEPGHCEYGNPEPNGNPADVTLSPLSHEHVEAITDPLGGSWYQGSSGQEVSDLCAGVYDANPSVVPTYNEVIGGRRYLLQYAWSNEVGGCRGSEDPPVAAFSARVGRAGTSTALNGSASGDADSSLVAYGWSFGDGRTGTGARPAHTYAHAGSYTVTLTIRAANGFRASVSHTISVAPRLAARLHVRGPALRTRPRGCGRGRRQPCTIVTFGGTIDARASGERVEVVLRRAHHRTVVRRVRIRRGRFRLSLTLPSGPAAAWRFSLLYSGDRLLAPAGASGRVAAPRSRRRR